MGFGVDIEIFFSFQTDCE